MPASSPYTSPEQQADLERLSGRLRARRKALGVTAVACAEAAGVSRVTLHRIEAGSPSVTIGAYINVAAALGLHLVVPILDAEGAGSPTITVGFVGSALAKAPLAVGSLVELDIRLKPPVVIAIRYPVAGSCQQR